MNILITNSVPLNGGDEALLRAVIGSLQRRWPNSEISVLCKQWELGQKFLPDLNLAPDLEFAKNAAEREQVSRLYRQADIVLSAPGGFLNDFYGVEDRLRGLEVALSLRKPVVLLAQSIGPFWKNRSRQRVCEVLKRISYACVRDQVSKECLLDIGIPASKIVQTTDAAFLWRTLEPDLFQKRVGPIRTIGLSFRVWPLEDSQAFKEVARKAETLCKFLLADQTRNLVFLSTCQGVPGYVDDSLIALEVVKRLAPELQTRCRIDRERREPQQLIMAMQQFDAFIGMRLHGCLLAMLAGTPALGLGYEQKTEEIFRQLELERYQTPFHKGADEWLRHAKQFLSEIEIIVDRLPSALDRLAEQASLNIDFVGRAIEENLLLNISGRRFHEQLDALRRYDPAPACVREVATLLRRLRAKKVLVLGRATAPLLDLCPEIEFVCCDFVPPEHSSRVFYQCDFNHQSLPHDLKELEVIVCLGVLENIDDVDSFVAQLRARLRPNGHLIATYFNLDSIAEARSQSNAASETSADGRTLCSGNELLETFQRAKFDLVDVTTVSGALKALRVASETVPTQKGVREFQISRPRLAGHFVFVGRRKAEAIDVRKEIAETIAPTQPGAPFILVDEAQWAIEEIDGRLAIPFLEKNGEYWGAPNDDEEAIRELNRLAQAGAAFVVFGAPAFWWLDYYSALSEYLRSKFTCVLENERLVIFDLRSAVLGGKAYVISDEHLVSNKTSGSYVHR